MLGSVFFKVKSMFRPLYNSRYRYKDADREKLMEYVNSDDSCIHVYIKHAWAQNKGSHVGKNWDRGWFIQLRLIHTLTWLNFAYHWLCVWFIGVWPKVGVQAFFTAGQVWRTPQSLQIKSLELNWVKRGTSHEPNSWIGFGSCEARRLTWPLNKVIIISGISHFLRET